METWIVIDLEEFSPTLTLDSAPNTDEMIVECSVVDVEAALQQGHINVDQAVWLHGQGMNWQIVNK